MATLRPHWPTDRGSIFYDDVASAPTLRRATKDGRIRRIAPGVYTADESAEVEQLVRDRRFEILARLVPDAVLVDRTAAENGNVSGGRLFVASRGRSANLKLPGLEVFVRSGAPLENSEADPPWAEQLRMSSPPRIIVDNLVPSRARGGPSRTLSLSELEEWLWAKQTAWGSERFERLRRGAHAVAGLLQVPERVEQIDELFAALRGSGPVRSDASPLVKAQAHGKAWDPDRVAAFETAAELLSTTHDDVWDSPGTIGEPTLWTELPFWESYLSNFIEGTVFTVDEAREIVQTQKVPSSRPADGHDILGTYTCVSDPVGRATTSEDAGELIDLLRARHRAMMQRRPEIGPGEWKAQPNMVGSYEFVSPELVLGTLLKGFSFVDRVPRGFRRALFLMYVVSETHPFADGNGRTARVMANAELSAVGQARIVIPIVYRNEYLDGLRALSRSGDTRVYGRVMAYAWRWTAAMPWDDQASCEGKLTQTNALLDSGDAARDGFRLEIP